MNSTVRDAFLAALAGKNERVIQLPHPRITFLAQNFNGRAALIAKLSLRPDQVVPDGRGFSVTTDRSGSNDFVRIASTDVGVSLLFLKLVDYIIERTAEVDERLASGGQLVAAINEFKRFSQRRPGRLSEDEIRGLLAELLLLLHLQGGQPARTWDVFASWGGPFGALHDFEFAAGGAIEVKSTHQPPAEIRISPHTQTSPLLDGLDLVVLPLERVSADSAATVRFIDIVTEVGQLASTHGGDVLEVWEAALIAVGLDTTDEYYEQWRFITGDWLRFKISDSFPRIHDDAIPDGVVKVSHSLQLNSLKDFAADFAQLEAGS